MARCYVCGTKNPDYFIGVSAYKIFKCPRCGLEYTDPVPTDREIAQFYSNYNDIRADSRIVRMNAVSILKHLSQRYGLTDESMVLDFGCGQGEFVNECGENCFGVELSLSMNNRIEKSIDDLSIKQFDFVIMLGVVEHLNDIINVFFDIKKIVKNGYIVITTVNAEGDIPYYYKPIEHLSYWTKSSFLYLSEMINADIVEYRPYHMSQLSHIYMSRLMSRTPKNLSDIIMEKIDNCLPEVVSVPTNEIFVVLKL